MERLTRHFGQHPLYRSVARAAAGRARGVQLDRREQRAEKREQALLDARLASCGGKRVARQVAHQAMEFLAHLKSRRL